MLSKLYSSENGLISIDEISEFMTRIIFDAVNCPYDKELKTEDLK